MNKLNPTVARALYVLLIIMLVPLSLTAIVLLLLAAATTNILLVFIAPTALYIAFGIYGTFKILQHIYKA